MTKMYVIEQAEKLLKKYGKVYIIKNGNEFDYLKDKPNYKGKDFNTRIFEIKEVVE